MQALTARFKVALSMHVSLDISVQTVTILQVQALQKCIMEPLTPTNGSGMESRAFEGPMT